MAQTKINFRQLIGKILNIGSTANGDAGLLTINRGDAPVTQTTLDIKGAATIEGALTIGGDLNIVGSINEQNVTNLNVADKTITLNKGGAAGSANGSGVLAEAGGAVVGNLAFDSTAATLFTIGNGTSQKAVVDASTAQTLTNKTLQSVALTGASTAPTAAAGTNDTTIATTGFVAAALSALGASSGYYRRTTVAGTQDGTNKTFAIGNALSTGSEVVTKNGVILDSGAANDYVLSGTGNTTLTFQADADAPKSDDKIAVRGVY